MPEEFEKLFKKKLKTLYKASQRVDSLNVIINLR